MLTVAHRAGNRVADLRAALASDVDLIEADVHLRAGTLQIGHGILGRRLVPAPTLDEILAVMDGDPRLLLDLKGLSTAVATAAAAMLVDTPVALSARNWRMFDAFGPRQRLWRIYAAGNRWELHRLRERIGHPSIRAVSVRRRLLTPAVVAELRGHGITVLVWPVSSKAAVADARRLGASGVIGKNLALLEGINRQP
ncbi:glycerophosphodiester phosphodiesterase [Asanoa iriomotensis]|uniref:Glycerophosphoryl diester phosphodiesterase n=1 Tax=Asanoa iriomotensis TaxID=234613 RepID=A0ABQ4BZB4_9ACTN|nr:glycerophosphodiester phosphodiesterase [Asanoa iriomotensis]GIF55859.1 hypothetical protein Air01nite_19540 [Asanoa iriomotensis]